MTNSNLIRNQILNEKFVPGINPSAMLNGTEIFNDENDSDIKQWPAVAETDEINTSQLDMIHMQRENGGD